MAKCNYCNEKASITLEKKSKKSKVNFCRVHWLALCMQETFKHFKLNNMSEAEIISIFRRVDFYSVHDPNEYNIKELIKIINN